MLGRLPHVFCVTKKNVNNGKNLFVTSVEHDRDIFNGTLVCFSLKMFNNQNLRLFFLSLN